MARLNPCPICGGEATGQFCKGDTLQFAYEHCGICGGYRNDWKAARIAWNKTTAEWILEKERTKVDRHTATECAYKNGFAAGMKAAEEKIVRCKDCKWYEPVKEFGFDEATGERDHSKIIEKPYGECHGQDFVFTEDRCLRTGENDFCSCGERRSDG